MAVTSRPWTYQEYIEAGVPADLIPANVHRNENTDIHYPESGSIEV